MIENISQVDLPCSMINPDAEIPSQISVLKQRLWQRSQKLLDDITPYIFARWLAASILCLAFLYRIFILQGWYLVTYLLEIYHLNLLVGFLSHPSYSAFDDIEEDEMPVLPTRQDEEFRPFIRKVPEFKCWCSVVKSTLLALVSTFFWVFNPPAFWPILLGSFICVSYLVMKRQIKHMIKYRYIPFSLGKPKYQRADFSVNANAIEG